MNKTDLRGLFVDELPVNWAGLELVGFEAEVALLLDELLTGQSGGEEPSCTVVPAVVPSLFTTNCRQSGMIIS
jgi:hypothetical protein